MDQVTMYRATIAAFDAAPEWPTSELIKTPLPATSAPGQGQPPVSFVNADVFALMAQTHGQVGVMNFASPTRPGGGVEFGARAQEESIAKGTYLVPALRQFQDTYYAPNRAQERRGLFSRSLIYSAHVRQLFAPDGTKLVPAHYVDIVTVAAPNRQVDPTLPEADALADIQYKLRQTLRAFKAHGADHLLLGAFGTGVFGNPVGPVGELFGEALAAPEFAGAFQQVIFAIYDRRELILPQFEAAVRKGMQN